MLLNPPVERLHFALTTLVVLERRIQRTIANLRGGVSSHPAARALLGRLEEMASTHLDALCERMQTTPDDDPRAPAGVDSLSASQSQFGELHPVSNALGVAYTIVQEAIIGYSTIQPIALRAADSWATADEGTTAHIARRHTISFRIRDHRGKFCSNVIWLMPDQLGSLTAGGVQSLVRRSNGKRR